MKQRRDFSRPAGESFSPDFTICEYSRGHLSDAQKCRVTNADYTIEKLRELVSDPVISDQVTRISRLLYDYLREIGDEGYPVKHLPAVMQVLDFLARRSEEVECYQAHLERMLQLCSRPPLLKRMSDNLISSVVMEQYFTLLGHLLNILPNEEQRRQICDALDCLLIGHARLTNVTAVKMDFRRRAVENSKLPAIVMELLKTASPETYPMILELALVLTSVSHQCCYRMLEAGILNTLLIRMDLPYATQLHCAKPPNIPLEGEEYSWNVMLLITNVLWNLMKSVLPPKTLPENLKTLPSPKRCAMWGLRYSFKRQILYGQYCAANLRIRNDIAGLILAGIIFLPSWNLVSSGIAEDIVYLLSAIESGNIDIWMNNVKLSDSEEDLFFKRILLMIVAHFADSDIYVFVMKKAKIIPIILGIIKFCRHNRDNKRYSSLIFLDYAMYILSLLAPRIPAEFVANKGTFTLRTMIDQVLGTKFDECFAMILVRTICSMILHDHVLLLDDFRKNNMIPSLISLIDKVLILDKLTLKRQRILTLLLIVLKNLMKKQTFIQQMFGERSVEIIREIFDKCLYQKNEDSQVDQRLLLAIGCYMWECVVRCPDNHQIFLKAGGLYSMLDIIETATYPVRCLYLGALTDICDYTFCGTFLCTWRGIDKKTGLLSLLASIWRQEEDRLGIKRCADGCIADLELPQMGKQQWIATYTLKLTADVSPAIVDMFGSMRSKIFSILKIIERDRDKYEMAVNHYKILLNDLPIEDCITFCCVDMYLRLKLGQMWTELSKYLIQVGIAPLIPDAQVVSHMVHWHHSNGIFIEQCQKKLVTIAKHEEAFIEMKELMNIRNSTLEPTLEALNEVERIRRIMDREYMLQKKKYQREQVNKALSFPPDASAERCHRTFSDKMNVTAVFGEHQLIDSSQIKNLTCCLMDLLPVSPPSDLQTEIFPLHEICDAMDNTLPYSNLLMNKYFIENVNQ